MRLPFIKRYTLELRRREFFRIVQGFRLCNVMAMALDGAWCVHAGVIIISEESLTLQGWRVTRMISLGPVMSAEMYIANESTRGLRLSATTTEGLVGRA